MNSQTSYLEKGDFQMKKFITVLVLSLLMLGLFCTTAQAAPDIKVYVDGKAITFTDAKPFIDKNYRTQVPMRALGEALGCKVDYIKDMDPMGFFSTRIDLSKSTADGKLWKTTFWGPYNDIYSGYFNGWQKRMDVTVETPVVYYPNTYKEVTMDTAPTMINARSYLPARYVAESFGYNIVWDGKTNSVIVTTNPNAIFHQKPANVPNYPMDLVLGTWSLTDNSTKQTSSVKITEEDVIYTTNGKSYTYDITGFNFDENSASYYINVKRGNMSTLINFLVYGYGDQAICFHRLEPNGEFFGTSSFTAHYVSQELAYY